MVKRLVAIAFIYACTTIAWMILGANIHQRTNRSDSYLRGRVGKRARVRERRYTGPEEVVQAGLLHEPAAVAAAGTEPAAAEEAEAPAAAAPDVDH